MPLWGIATWMTDNNQKVIKKCIVFNTWYVYWPDMPQWGLATWLTNWPTDITTSLYATRVFKLFKLIFLITNTRTWHQSSWVSFLVTIVRVGRYYFLPCDTWIYFKTKILKSNMKNQQMKTTNISFSNYAGFFANQFNSNWMPIICHWYLKLSWQRRWTHRHSQLL